MNDSPGNGTPSGSSRFAPIAVYTLGGLLILTLLSIPLRPRTKARAATSHFSAAPHASSAPSAPLPQVPERPAEAVAPIPQTNEPIRIYLVQVGPHTSQSEIDELAQWLHRKYALNVEVLPPLALDRRAYDPDRKQYVSQLVTDQIKRDLPTLAADPNAYLIGFTDAPIYSITQAWDASFTQRDLARTAIVSTYGITAPWHSVRYPKLLTPALHRILLRDVALLAWNLPLNHNPRSILAPTLSLYTRGEDILTSELHPETTPYGRYVGDPCIVFLYTPAGTNRPAELKPVPGEIIQECSDHDQPSVDTEQERFQVRLRYGFLLDRRTDFSLAGIIPIHFERETSDQWRGPAPFGLSGSDNYDEYLATWDGMRHIGIANGAQSDEMLTRIPAWLPFLAFNKWVDEGSGKAAVLSWHGGAQQHFDLTRYTGEVSSYLPCDDKSPPCYLNNFRNAHGDALIFARDADRSLERLTSPGGGSVTLSYDASRRISQIVDSRGRQVLYRYNDAGMLVGVTYPSGETLSYTYDSAKQLLTFGAAPDAHTAPVLLLTNEYASGRLSRQTLAGGDVYRYFYGTSDSTGKARLAGIVKPDGRSFSLSMGDDNGTIVLERNVLPTAPSRPANTSQYAPGSHPWR